jgi:hypothetical protein
MHGRAIGSAAIRPGAACALLNFFLPREKSTQGGDKGRGGCEELWATRVARSTHPVGVLWKERTSASFGLGWVQRWADVLRWINWCRSRYPALRGPAALSFFYLPLPFHRPSLFLCHLISPSPDLSEQRCPTSHGTVRPLSNGSCCISDESVRSLSLSRINPNDQRPGPKRSDLREPTYIDTSLGPRLSTSLPARHPKKDILSRPVIRFRSCTSSLRSFQHGEPL